LSVADPERIHTPSPEEATLREQSSCRVQGVDVQASQGLVRCRGMSVQTAFRMGLARVVLVLSLLALQVPAVVDAEATDATKSESSGNGLQFATAGVLAQFTVTAKDESGVRRTSGGDEWIVELDGTRSIGGSVVDNLDGTYQVSYTATKSGSYEAGIKLAKSGGLTGSYFENVWFFYTPVKVTVDPQINMDWGVGRITPTGANYISVRWCVPLTCFASLCLALFLCPACFALVTQNATRLQ